MDNEWSFHTKAIHYEKKIHQKTGAISQEIIPAVAYSFENAETATAVVSGKESGTYYGRYGNPTTSVLEKKIARLENAEAALGVSSGMAAISIALMANLSAGDHVIVTKDVYGGTHKFLSTIAPRYGIKYDYVDCTNIAQIEHAIKENTKVVYIETPSNPTLTIIDIQAVAEVAKRNRLKLIVDNTFMTPYLQNPLDLGADIVVHSATKYLNGHGDVIAGMICGLKEEIEYMRHHVMGDLGQNLNAFESFLILRGLKTLALRMEQHCNSAQKIAEFLENHPYVNKVFYPGLPSHPQFELAKKQMKANGGIVSFEIKGGVKAGVDFISNLKMAMISFSLGDPETLVQHPASMTHSSIPADELGNFGLTTGLIRLSVGLEDVQDIILDLEQALTSISIFANNEL